ncbi:uncharacterized protein LOC125370430 [Ricinus communis]|uniref:uncharacterized protein LOC125370430 n=1 Tax=Ricinus communis TaxID=3988 RepID=UPI00201AEE17|nr:uncharacterized protein LOC125370430 [Ricinus communis]
MANPPREVGAEKRITMKDYAMPTISNTTSCIVLGDTSRNYELKSIHFNMLPSFYGMPSEDALTFIREFYAIVHTFPLSGLNEDQLRMRTPDEVYNIFEMLGANSQQKSVRTKRIEVNEVVANSKMTMQLSELTKQVNMLTSTKNSPNNEVCGICGIYGHSANVCSSFDNYRENMYDQINLMDSYQPMHPMNDPYSNTYNTDRMERNEKKTDSIEASLKRLEAQMEQIVEELNKEELSNQPEQANSITTIRRGTPKNDGLVQSNEESIQKEEKVEPNLRLEKKENEAFSRAKFHKAAQPYKPPIHFLNQPKDRKNDENKPAYAKFFEELNTNKRRYANNEKVQVASVILQHQLPLKMKDPDSFTIDITIGDKKHTKVMLDLGASINLMPYSIYERLGLGGLKPTTMSLQFADISIKYPRGIVEDLLVQVGKLIIPVDFVVLDMENTPTRDKEQTILLGRPFMTTTRTVIDMHDEKLTMTVLGETVEFKVFDFLTLSSKSTIDKCSYNYLDSLVYEQLYDDIPFLIDKSFHDTLDVRINSMKPYLKGMTYDEKVECADERPP